MMPFFKSRQIDGVFRTTREHSPPSEVALKGQFLRWGEFSRLPRQWFPGLSARANAMSGGYPASWYKLRLPPPYIALAYTIQRRTVPVVTKFRNSPGTYIPGVFVPTAMTNSPHIRSNI